jgi:hypothetical protein
MRPHGPLSREDARAILEVSVGVLVDMLGGAASRTSVGRGRASSGRNADLPTSRAVPGAVQSKTPWPRIQPRPASPRPPRAAHRPAAARTPRRMPGGVGADPRPRLRPAHGRLPARVRGRRAVVEDLGVRSRWWHSADIYASRHFGRADAWGCDGACVRAADSAHRPHARQAKPTP